MKTASRTFGALSSLTSGSSSPVRLLAGWMQANHMAHLGIANTMRAAYAFNRVKYGPQHRARRRLYRTQFASLLQENGAPSRPLLRMKDGWAVDTSLNWPHLDRVLEDSEKIIAERSGERLSETGTYRSYFQDVWTPADAERYPSFLDFVTSSEVLATVADYLQCIPALSTTLPPGIRFVESNVAFDDRPDTPKDSQLYHIDYYSRPNVYLILMLRDTTPETGPFSFLPRSETAKAARQLGYWSRRRGYRVSDQEIYSVADRKQVVEACYPRGTVLFVESSGCFHFGSRNSVVPRFQLMVGYTGACRTDFSQELMTPCVYPIRDTDSRLRKMVLNKNLLE